MIIPLLITFKGLDKKINVAVHTFYLDTLEAEAGGSLPVSSRLVWSIELVPGQSGLHRETLS